MSANAAPAPDELRQMLQTLLDDKRLAQYYHFDVRPQRLPLQILNRSSLNMDLSGLSAAGRATRQVTEAGPNTLVITAVEADDLKVDVRFEFQAEGLRGHGQYLKASEGWKLDRLSVVER